MIVNVGGTSGSGKTFIARRIIELYDERVPIMKDGRKKPYAYCMYRRVGCALYVMGHYEGRGGGCDTWSRYGNFMDLVFDTIKQYHNKGFDVFFEGMMINDDTKRAAKLHEEGYPLHVVSIDLSLEKCLETINARRRERDPNASDVDPFHTERRYKTISRRIPRLVTAGVPALFLPREEAFMQVVKWLGLENAEANERHL